MDTIKNTLDDVIAHFGSATKTAAALNTVQSGVSNWRVRGVPAHIAIEIERITDGKFRAIDLYRPG